ncbi:MAG: hypothetical protein WCV00_22570 [Verrucomicrobiia bacterium]|jgi:hypothetical protein
MPAVTKKQARLKLQVVANADHSIHAGLVAVEALARRFGLWQKLRACRGLGPRRDRKRGCGPEVTVGQLIYARCSGGGCLSDSEAINDDPLARALFGVGKFADQSQVGERVCDQSGESVAALRGLLHELMAWVWQHTEPWRLLRAGQREVFFDDTQLEVCGAGPYLDAIKAEGWHCTVSYNKGRAAGTAGGDGRFERLGFIACDEDQSDIVRVGKRHHLKGEKEQLFSEVLNGLDPRTGRRARRFRPIRFTT